MRNKRLTRDYLIGQGCETNLADYLSRRYSLEQLKQESLQGLQAMGLSAAVSEDIKNGRPPIPPETLDAVLQKNLRICCVCYDESRSVILHHIKPYATEKKHEESNLCVLCLQCHGRAHSKHELEQNLNEDRLLVHKNSWEAAVAHRKTWVLYSAQNWQTTSRWEWVNLKRLESIIPMINADLPLTEERKVLENSDYVAKNGYTFFRLDPSTNQGMRFVTDIGQLQSTLAAYITQLVEQIAHNVPVLDVTEYSDKPDLLSKLLTSGMYLCAKVELHVDEVKPNQFRAIGRNKRLTLTFEFDQWNFTSSTSREIGWKHKKTTLVSFGLVRSIEVDRHDGNIHVTLSPIGLSTLFAPNDFFEPGFYN